MVQQFQRITKIPPKIFQYILCYGSTSTKTPPDSRIQLFQYILCYGSTLIHIILNTKYNYFNTSYVMVQPQTLGTVKTI